MRVRTVLLYALPLLLLLAAVILGVVRGQQADSVDDRPLALPPVEAPDAAGPACTRLLAELEADLPAGEGTLPRKPLAPPAPPGAIAWDTAQDGAVVLRCGLPKPAELVPGAALLQVNGVTWLTLSQPDRDTFITADRPVFVALTVPRGLGSGPIQAVSDVVRTAVPGT